MIKVLIIEDDPMVKAVDQQYLSRVISSEQLNIATVDNGSDAIVSLSDEPVDLILLDVYMPKLSGTDVLNWLLHHQQHPQVIMLTAANDSDHVKEAVNYGVLDYLVKPYTFDRFKQAINKFLYLYTSLANEAPLSQQALDAVFANSSAQISGLKRTAKLPKGLSQLSLDRITTAIDSLPSPFSVQEAAQAAKLSRISTKKYLDYLLGTHQLMATIKYLSVGRPLTVYQLTR